MNVPRFAWWLILAVCLIVGQAIQGAAAPSHASPNALTPEEITEGWLLLFDGETLFGWQPSSEANWAVADGVLTASEGKPGLLLTTSQWFTLTIHADGPHVAT